MLKMLGKNMQEKIENENATIMILDTIKKCGYKYKNMDCKLLKNIIHQKLKKDVYIEKRKQLL